MWLLGGTHAGGTLHPRAGAWGRGPQTAAPCPLGATVGSETPVPGWVGRLSPGDRQVFKSKKNTGNFSRN